MDSKTNPVKKIKTRGIYLLPNLLTTAALFSGFYSIVAAMKGYFDVAAIAVFIAMVLDGLDGRVARMTNTQTAFGAEYDSLSDMVAFAIAPSLIVYSWSLHTLGKFGWLVAFIYTAATALRLARFNTQSHDTDKRYFQGLPSPAAAAVVAGMVWCASYYEISGMFIAVPAAVVTLCAAALMVSRVRYYSFKQIDFKGKVPFIMVVILVFIIAGIAIDPPQILFGVFLVYGGSGPVVTLWQLRKMRRRLKMDNKK
ncbi:MAG TPA: CDP-diacylglycerol--serine O-phosphatidyltransferase [Gammaproteobacteria bacterium]|nr:CDP-diacylglycerol--serine O-phosphatidyltransferase [Gammaproteobacteria bacterium]